MASTLEDQFRMQVAADTDPILKPSEIQMLMEMFATLRTFSIWKPSTPYGIGDRVLPMPRTGQVFEVTTAGTSGTDQPKWKDEPDNTQDDDVTWVVSSIIDIPFDMVKATAQGWRIKAGKCVNRVDFRTDVTSITRDQLYKHCIDMFKQYSRGLVSVPVTPLGHMIVQPTRPPMPVIGNAP